LTIQQFLENHPTLGSPSKAKKKEEQVAQTKSSTNLKSQISMATTTYH